MRHDSLGRALPRRRITRHVDARLIAAAPALLEAAKAALVAVEYDIRADLASREQHSVARMLRIAIAKAEGQKEE